MGERGKETVRATWMFSVADPLVALGKVRLLRQIKAAAAQRT